jgi:chromate reductase
LKVIGFSGSLRKDSYNSAVLRELGRLAPARVSLEIADWRHVPVYDADLELPAVVADLKRQVADADAVLIVTPEYNYGIPGGLKNVLDWLSRPAFESVFAHKPVGVMSVSPGATGGARAQAQLKNVLLSMVAQVFPHPEVAIGAARERVVEGRIAREDTEKLLRGYMQRFGEWAARTR